MIKPTGRAWLAAATATGAACWAVADYRRWRRLGPGGLPASWGGWLTTTRLRLQMRDPLSTVPLLARLGEQGDRARLSDLPRRVGRRPRIAPHPVPHRQLDQHAPPPARALLEARFEAVVAANPARLVFAQSHFEKRHRAVTAPARRCADAVATHGEVAHIHPADGSMHMVLGPSDCCDVIRAGWGERHGLAGVALALPPTYTLIYAPRTAAEVPVIARILAAAVDHMTCTASGQMPPVASLLTG